MKIKIMLLLLYPFVLFAQKPRIDSSTFERFPFVADGKISANGEFVSYSEFGKINSILVKSVKGNRQWRSYKLGHQYQFTDDNRYFIYGIGIDGIMLLNLKSFKSNFLNGYKLEAVLNGKSTLLIYSRGDTLIFHDLKSVIQTKYAHYKFEKILSQQHHQIVVSKEVNTTTRSLILLNTNTFAESIIKNFSVSDKVSALSFNMQCIAFALENKEGKFHTYAYKIGSNKVIDLFQGQKPDQLYFNSFTGISDDGDKIIVTFNETKRETGKSVAASFDLWSYTDKKLQSQQLPERGSPLTTVLFNLNSNDFRRIGRPGDATIFDHNKNVFQNRYVIFIRSGGSDLYSEWYWNRNARYSLILYSIDENKEYTIAEDLTALEMSSANVDPDGQSVLYYSAKEKNWIKYTLSSKESINLTAGIKTTWTTFDEANFTEKKDYLAEGIAGFIAKTKDVLIYDQNDIWKINLLKPRQAVNVTNGYGKAKSICFRLLFKDDTTSGELILSAFDRDTKRDGFYAVNFNSINLPRYLTMGNFTYTGTTYIGENYYPPVKAKNDNVYLVRRMSSTEAPNYFVTSDFRSFKAVTDVHPEKGFNWLTTELVKWQIPNGSTVDGMLFKPEDFDPDKKYPLIVHYYEKNSSRLNTFLFPEWSMGNINIPWYVSNGYLVFVPDINIEIGKPGISVLDCVLTGVKSLYNRQYIDTTRIGIQGHSRGGWETNYLITHSHMFKAAVAAAGFSNYLELFGQVTTGSGLSWQAAFEVGKQRIGVTVWDRPDLYIENSPLFFVKNITTPLLMMNNKNDGQVYFTQGVEFFTALRRLGKKAWMLQYDNEDHIVFGEASKDFTLRTKQFFDHYLMNKPAPKWMLDGIPASRKGIDDGLELDSTGRTPGPSPLISNPNK